MPNTLLKARVTTEKASLTSKKSTSSLVSPALCKAFGAARVGAVVNHSGSCAASANARISALGFSPYFSTAFSPAMMSADAPSFIVEEVAAVAVPSLINAGRREGIFQISPFCIPHLQKLQDHLLFVEG